MGPVDEDEIAELFREGRIRRGTVLSSPPVTHGMWVPFSALDFSAALKRYDKRIEEARRIEELARQSDLRHREEAEAIRKAEVEAKQKAHAERMRLDAEAERETRRLEELSRPREPMQVQRPPRKISSMPQKPNTTASSIVGVIAICITLAGTFACMGICAGGATRSQYSDPSYVPRSSRATEYRSRDIPPGWDRDQLERDTWEVANDSSKTILIPFDGSQPVVVPNPYPYPDD